MKNKSLFTTALTVLLMTSPYTFAGDQPVNCQLVNQEVKLYGEHQASCYSTNPYPIPNVQLSEYVTEQSSSTIVLQSFNYPFPASCRAQLNYYRSVYQQTPKCEYTPAAKFYRSQVTYPVLATVYTSNSSDRDGQIVKTEWLSAGNVIGTGASYSYINQTKPASLQLKVTDNHGHSDSVVIF